MRTGNLTSLSERDWASVRELREFARQEQEEQRLAEDRAQYEHQYLATVEEQNQRVAPVYRIEAIPFDTWRAYADQSIAAPVVRGAAATNAALLSKVRSDEAVEAEAERKQARADVLAGKPDKHFWKIPAADAGLSMSVEQAKAFAREQGRLFVEHNPEFYPCPSNVAAITEYLTTNSVVIPTAECCRLAWLRLRELSLIEEPPASSKEPEPVTQPSEPIPAESELVDGYDLATGEPRKYTQREIWNMDSSTYRKAFKAWGENRPKFTRGYFGPR